MTLIKTSLGLFFLFAIACNSSKTVTENDENMTNTFTEMSSEMADKGYERAVVISSEVEDDCPFTLMIGDKKDNLVDPINLDASYQKNGTKLWVQYRALRMQNRCDKANPVELTEVEDRKE